MQKLNLKINVDSHQSSKGKQKGKSLFCSNVNTLVVALTKAGSIFQLLNQKREFPIIKIENN